MTHTYLFRKLQRQFPFYGISFKKVWRAEGSLNDPNSPQIFSLAFVSFTRFENDIGQFMESSYSYFSVKKGSAKNAGNCKVLHRNILQRMDVACRSGYESYVKTSDLNLLDKSLNHIFPPLTLWIKTPSSFLCFQVAKQQTCANISYS